MLTEKNRYPFEWFNRETMGTEKEVGTNIAASTSRICSNGGASVTARGVVWNTSQQPTIALTTKTADGADTGTFVRNLTGLLPETSSFVRTYATNFAGTAYGEGKQITTLIIGTKGDLPEKTLTVFPNPFSTKVLFHSASEEKISVVICDVFARELLIQKFRGFTE